MKVYIVFSGDYSDRGIVGVFSSREKADEFIAERKKEESWYGSDVEEWEVDKMVGAVTRRAWLARVENATGEIRTGHGEGFTELAGPNLRSKIDRGEKHTHVYSYESPDHAHKVAVEEYQRRMREAATRPPAAG